MITGEQIRAARAMLRLEQTQLSEQAGISVETLKRFEATEGELKGRTENVVNLRRVLEVKGIEFIDDDQFSAKGGPGIRLIKNRSITEWNRQVDEVFAALKETKLYLHLDEFVQNEVSDFTDGTVSLEHVEALIAKAVDQAHDALKKISAGYPNPRHV